MRSWHRFARSCTLLTLLLSAWLPGCTLVGAGVGAGIDSLIPGPYQERPSAELMRLERDQRVLVLLRDGTHVTGQYRGMHGPTSADLERYLLVSTADNLVSVRTSDVSSVAVEVMGKGWLYGGLIGLTADAVIIVAGFLTMQNTDFKLTGDPSGCFC